MGPCKSLRGTLSSWFVPSDAVMAVMNLRAPLCILLAALLLHSRLSDQHHVITTAVIGPGIASLPDKLCSIWCFTQDA